MRRKNLSAGDTVEAHCTRCRLVTNHTVIAMVGETPARVQCNTCGGFHKFRQASRGEASRKAPSGTPRKTRETPQDAGLAEWQKLIPTMDRSRAVPYGMNQSYPVGALLEHPLFGLGVVTAAPGPNRIEVLFREGRKLLRCGR
jgi:hypothetical protein